MAIKPRISTVTNVLTNMLQSAKTTSSTIVTSQPVTIPSAAPTTGQLHTLQQNAQVVTNTTTLTRAATDPVNPVVGNVLTDVGIIPYMRYLAIDFIGYRLRPNREIWFYFDGQPVNRYIQKPNIIEVNTSDKVNDMRSGPQRTLRIGASSARILHVETSDISGNTKFYVSDFTSPVKLASGNTVTVDGYAYSTTLKSYEHYSGKVQTGSTNTAIKLSDDANSTTDDYYVGNTITIVNGTNAGQQAVVASYNCLNRIATVGSGIGLNPRETNLIYNIGNYTSWVVANSYPAMSVSSRGLVSGVFHVPDPNKNPSAAFRTGDRIFRILDNPRNDSQSYTTRADYRFTANGLDLTKAQIIERQITIDFPPISVPVTSLPPITTTPPVTTPPPTNPCAPTVSINAQNWSWSVPPTGRKSLSTTTETGTTTASDSFYKNAAGASVARLIYTKKDGTPILGAPNIAQNPDNIVNKVKANQPKVLPWRIPFETSTPAGTRFTTPTDTNGRTYIKAYRAWDGKYYGSTDENWRATTSTGIDVTNVYFWELMYDIGQADANQCIHIPHDPVAQSFYVSAAEHPDGVFISSVDLFFKNKGDTLPVEVQIRPVVNGFPSSNTIIPGATTTLETEDIVVSDFPDANSATTNTRFSFASPVYLNSGYEYAVVVITDDYGYDYYGAAKGQTILGTDQVVSQQPFLGSLFKSQNQMTWTPIQEEDMMFVLNKAEFNTTQGTAIFEENKDALLDDVASNTAYDAFTVNKANTYYDSFELRSDAIELNNTKLTYYLKGVSNDTLTMDTAYTNFNPDQRFDLPNRNILFNPQLDDKSMLMRVDLSTKNKDVSPVIFHERQNMVTIENLINNTGIPADRYVITNPGSSYSSNAAITITGSKGYGANAWAVANTITGNIVSVVVDSEGVGYVDDIVITITGGGGSGATINVSSETDASGGPALARYISKTVTLLDGFDAGDLRVFLTAVKPPGSNVNVYYKVRNSLDPERIENRKWKRMEQKTSEYTFSVNRDPVEYEYRPSMTSNNITYKTDTTTYKTFNQFAIKIVLSAPNTVANSIPYVLDVRAIALPEDAY